jgi:MFS transporter, OFA family, oxalate/formate antiporter
LAPTSVMEKHKIFHGYWIVAAAFACLFVKSGCSFFAFSLFVKPLEVSLGWSRGAIMAAFTIHFLVMGLAAPIIGRIVDQYGANRVVLAGAGIVGMGFASLSQVTTILHFYVGYAVAGLGMAALAEVPTTFLVSNWFQRRRGLAIGMMSTGLGAGGFVLAPLVGACLIPVIGWRTSYLILGLLAVALVAPLALWVLRTRPEEMGLGPDGSPARKQDLPPPAPALSSGAGALKTAFASFTFWLIALSFFLSNFSHVGVLQSQIPYFLGMGLSIALAAAALGGIGVGSIVGKVAFGWLCDVIGPKYACVIGLCFQLASIVLILNVGPTSSHLVLWAYVVTMGLGTGSWLPTLSMLVSTNFGLASYGAIFGFMNFFLNLGISTGPLAAGLVYDITQNYRWAFLIFACFYVIAIPSLLATRQATHPGSASRNTARGAGNHGDPHR